jgi:hypothetical protein
VTFGNLYETALSDDRLQGHVLDAAMVLAMWAAGSCLLDGDEHKATIDDCASFDFCLGLAVASVAVIFLSFVSIYPLAPIRRRRTIR